MRAVQVLLVAFGTLAMMSELGAQGPSVYVLGGSGGVSWSQAADFQLMVDDTATPRAIQPLELAPNVNILPQLAPWWELRSPYDPAYREGHPRAWQGVNATASAAYRKQIQSRRWVDGDPSTYTEIWDAPPHFYTIDMGAPLYAERLVFYAPREGESVNTGDQFYPKYILENYELYGSASENSGQLLDEKIKGTSYSTKDDWYGAGMCCPLESPLGAEDSNTDTVTVVDFPLQPLRFLRLLLLADSFRANGTGVVDFWANAEMEVYGRGFAPDCLWESKVIDMGQGQPVNLGRVYYEVSHWRRDPESGELTAVQEDSSRILLELQTGSDLDPVAHYVYNDLGGLSEAPRAEWMALDNADILGGTEGPGFRGPRADDRENWSFWSQPIAASGALARMPVGRYLRLRLRLQSESPWEFARVHSVRIERGPLLADQIVGEVGSGGQIAAAESLPMLSAGDREPIVLELRADFGGAGQQGFDGLRITTPLEIQFDSLAIGRVDGNMVMVQPDSVVSEPSGLAVYLPPNSRIKSNGDRRARVFLSARLFGAASELAVEVFDRTQEHLAQQVSGGDATELMASDRMLVVATEGTGADVIGSLNVTPRIMTPQGDGINDVVDIEYAVFHVLGTASVQTTVHRLDGTEVWRAPAAMESAGRRVVTWNGRDGSGNLVLPGVYLVRVEVDAEAGRAARVQSIAVAY
jgi:hypothetical protein